MDAKVSEPGVSPATVESLTHKDRRLIVISMMLPVFLGSIDQSILATSLPTIGRALGDVHNLPWLITSFLIASTALTPLYGKFADIHGRRAALLIALGVYMVGSLLAASSTSMLMLICGRIVQGCGGGGLTAISQMILGDVAAPKDRAKYYAYFSIAFTTAGGTGPVLGGWICDHLYWWVIFLWNFPLCVGAVILTLTMLRKLPRHDRPHKLDFFGAVLVMAASSSFMLALNLGGVRYPWFSSPVLALVGCALVLGGGFVVRQLTTTEPLIPLAILADRTARLAMLAHSFGWGSILALNIFLPMYLQTVLGWSATSSGLSLMILMVTLNASAGLSSQLVGRVKHYKLLPMIFLFVGIGAVVALALSAATMTTRAIRDHFVPDRCRFRPDRAAHSGRAAKHRVDPSSRRGDRHHEFRAHADEHDPGRDIRRHRARDGPHRGVGRHLEPARLGGNLGRNLHHGVLRRRDYARHRPIGHDPGRGEAAGIGPAARPGLATIGSLAPGRHSGH